MDSDTEPRAMEVWLDLIRRMPPAERFARGMELTDLAAKVSEAGVRAMYPRAGERAVFLRTAARRLPRESMIQAYGWDPESDVLPR